MFNVTWGCLGWKAPVPWRTESCLCYGKLQIISDFDFCMLFLNKFLTTPPCGQLAEDKGGNELLYFISLVCCCYYACVKTLQYFQSFYLLLQEECAPICQLVMAIAETHSKLILNSFISSDETQQQNSLNLMYMVMVS